MTDAPYRTDPIAPVSIHHLFDAVDRDLVTGAIGQTYNYLNYLFEENGKRVEARAYLDEPSTVYVQAPLREHSPFERAILLFLATRFSLIKCRNGESFFELPADVRADLEAGVQHILIEKAAN